MHLVRRRPTLLTKCPVCGDELPISAIRCAGCSVVVGAGSSSRFAPMMARSRPSRVTKIEVPATPGVVLALICVLGTLGFAAGTFLVVAGASLLIGAAIMIASAVVLVAALRPAFIAAR